MPEIWIVNPYGTLPGEGWREYRSALLAKALAMRGHKVRWWISDIEHRSKTRRPLEIADPFPGLDIQVEVVPTRSYRRNISVGRVRYERSFAQGFSQRSSVLPPPALLVLADPALFFGKPVADYARRSNVPLVLDVLDLWPELFNILLPVRLRGMGKVLFAPMYRRRDRLVAQAAAVVAVTRDYLEAVSRNVAPRLGEVVYLGVDCSAFLPPQPRSQPDAPLEVIYAGTLGEAYDMPAVLKAFERLASAERAVRLTVAGDGPWAPQVDASARRFPRHVRYLGRVPADALALEYAGAHVGLASYAAGSTVSMPVKLFDYMAAGLATVGAIGGEAGALLRKGVGRPYQPGSAEDLVRAVEFFCHDRNALDEARRKALALSVQFDQSEQYRRYAALVEGLIGTRG